MKNKQDFITIFSPLGQDVYVSEPNLSLRQYASVSNLTLVRILVFLTQVNYTYLYSLIHRSRTMAPLSMSE